MGEAHDWKENNKLFGRVLEKRSLAGRLGRKMTSVAVWGIAGVGKSALVRTIYYKEMLKLKKKNDDFVMFSWVDVPDQFNLSDLSQRLLLDFHSDDLQAKESAAISIMESQDPIQGCCKILCRHRCLIVIDGLRLAHDWDSIKDAFLSDAQTTGSCIVVITNEEKAAEHVIRHVPGSTVLNVKGLKDCMPIHSSKRFVSAQALPCAVQIQVIHLISFHTSMHISIHTYIHIVPRKVVLTIL